MDQNLLKVAEDMHKLYWTDIFYGDYTNELLVSPILRKVL